MTYRLHFRKSAARVLFNFASALKAKSRDGEHIELFETAAKAAKAGQPLTVEGTEAEANAMAEGFTRYGVARPRVESVGA